MTTAPLQDECHYGQERETTLHSNAEQIIDGLLPAAGNRVPPVSTNLPIAPRPKTSPHFVNGDAAVSSDAIETGPRPGLDTNQPTADTCQRPHSTNRDRKSPVTESTRMHCGAAGKAIFRHKTTPHSTLRPNNSAPSAQLPDPKQRFVSNSSSSICVTRNSPEISHGTPDGNPKFGPEGRLGNRHIPLEQQNCSQLSDRFTIFL